MTAGWRAGRDDDAPRLPVSARCWRSPWRERLDRSGLPPGALALGVPFDAAWIARAAGEGVRCDRALLAATTRSIVLLHPVAGFPMSLHLVGLEQLHVIAVPGSALRLEIGTGRLADVWVSHALTVGEPATDNLVRALAMLRGFTWPDGT